MLISIFSTLLHNPFMALSTWVVYKVTISVVASKKGRVEEISKKGEYTSETQARIKTHNQIKEDYIHADKVEESTVTHNGETTWVIKVAYGIFELLFLPFNIKN